MDREIQAIKKAVNRGVQRAVKDSRQARDQSSATGAGAVSAIDSTATLQTIEDADGNVTAPFLLDVDELDGGNFLI